MEDAPYGDEQTTLLVDNWLCVQIKSHILKDIFLLRHRLAQCFTAKVKDPKRGFNRGHQALLETMVRVLDVEWANSGLNYSLKWASRDNNPPSRSCLSHTSSTLMYEKTNNRPSWSKSTIERGRHRVIQFVWRGSPPSASLFWRFPPYKRLHIIAPTHLHTHILCGGWFWFGRSATAICSCIQPWQALTTALSSIHDVGCSMHILAGPKLSAFWSDHKMVIVPPLCKVLV